MIETSPKAIIGELRKVLKRLHYPLEVMLVCARWYAAYPLSFRHLEEMMQERGVIVDRSTVHRWSLKRYYRNNVGWSRTGAVFIEHQNARL